MEGIKKRREGIERGTYTKTRTKQQHEEEENEWINYWVKFLKSNAEKTGFIATRGLKIHCTGTKTLLVLKLCK